MFVIKTPLTGLFFFNNKSLDFIIGFCYSTLVTSPGKEI